MDKTYKRKDIDKTTIEFEVTIPKDSFTKSYETILERESKKVEIKGFRKGSVPKDLVEKQIKPAVLQEVLERIAPVYVAQAITVEEVEVIAPPRYKDIPELDVNKDITFKVDVTIMPDFKIGDLKKVKVEKKKVEVTEKEIEDLVKELEANVPSKAKKGSDKWAVEMSKQINSKDVKTMEDLKKELTKLLTAQKENIIKREYETEVLKKAIEVSKIELPQPAIDYEAYEREHNFMHTLEDRKIELDQFLKANNLTIEIMREMWAKDAKEALEADAFLRSFGVENKLEVTDEELKAEVEKVKKENNGVQYNYDDKQWQEYIRRVLLKEKAFAAFIEKVEGKKK